MRRRSILGAVGTTLVIMGLAAPAAAQTYMSGDAYYHACARSAQSQIAWFCQGYLAGALDGKPGRACPLDGTAVSDLVERIIFYLRDHPEVWNAPASETIVATVAAWHPCKDP